MLNKSHVNIRILLPEKCHILNTTLYVLQLFTRVRTIISYWNSLADVKVYSSWYCDSCDSLNWVLWQISANKAEQHARKQLCILLLCNTATQKKQNTHQYSDCAPWSTLSEWDDEAPLSKLYLSTSS